ncbi:mechanosensitive ion channel family protein [Taibaiella soli]|uniref:Mechanosensitive ion channel family protein n=1 Tax=Taibaiella soli TaxID=1649169 RepID=A0A2W2AFT7_9BACT|nr:mechanosensitive ion channel family protein [Taibaiella soli]PZF74375.1 mechanosensitive ion channel family protein [Taibaiella soli]
MKHCFPLLVFLFLNLHFSANAQIDTAGTDSLRDAALQANVHYLAQLDSAHLGDSLKRVQLESELAALKADDHLKRADLQKQIKVINADAEERILKRAHRIDSLRLVVKGFPVAPFGDTLFYVYTRLGPFSAHARAQAIDTKVNRIVDKVFYKADSLIIINGEESVDLVYEDMIILSITPNDAMWMNASQAELAKQYRDAIIKSIATYKEATSLQTRLKQVGMTLVVVLLAIIIIYLINILYRRVKHFTINRELKYVKGVHIRNYELFSVSTEKRLLLGLLNLLRWITILTLLYLTLPLLFSIFPWTKHFGTTLIGYVINPLKSILVGVWDYMPKLITIIVVVVVFYYVIKALRFFKNEIESGALKIPGFYTDWASPSFQIARVLMLAFMLVVIFPYLPGSDSPVFKGVSVFLGVLFTFGSSGSLSNLMAGFVLTYMRAYKIGDRVKIGEVTGDIVAKTLLVTRIRTIKNEDITIPNSMIMNNHTVNYSSSSQELGLILHTKITIGYDAPWRQIHELLLSAALATEDVLNDPKPFVHQESLDDYYVTYQINVYTNHANSQAHIYSALHQNIQDKFFEAGVEIMSPRYDAIRDGNNAAIPPDYLPEDYVAPGFKVKQTHPTPKGES